MKPLEPQNILIINLKFLGDLIVTTAAIKAIRTEYKAAKITVLVRKQYKDVLAGNENIDEIISFDLTNKDKKGFAKLNSEIGFVRFLRSNKFDSVVLLQAGDRYVLWSFLCGAKYRVGPIENNMSFLLTHTANVFENKNSFMEYYLNIAKTFGAHQLSRQTEYVLNQKFRNGIEEFYDANNIDQSDQIICIHPGAGETSRKWKLENYPLLINKILNNTKYKVVFTLGPQEFKHKEFFDSIINKRVFIHVSENVQDLAWIISSASLLIGMDSGARHLAAAIKIPSLSLFPDDMLDTWWFYEESNKQFKLIGRRNKTDIENQFLDNISVEDVFQKTMQILEMR